MNDNSIVVQILIIFLILIVVGGNLGLNYEGTIGMPEPVEMSERPDVVGIDIPFYEGETYVAIDEGDTGFLSWLWRGISFFVMMITFQVPNLPVWISTIFIAMSLMILFVVIKWARGTGGT